MSTFANMLVPFTVLLIFINLLFVGLTFLPSNTIGTEFYDFGLSQDDIADLNSIAVSFRNDALGITQDVNALTATDAPVGSLNIVDSILLAFGKAFDSVTGTVLGGISLVANIVKYLTLVIFGYLFWIDYFLAPLTAVPTIGSLFTNIGLALKIMFFIIQLVGLTALFLPLFSGGRRT